MLSFDQWFLLAYTAYTVVASWRCYGSREMKTKRSDVIRRNAENDQ